MIEREYGVNTPLCTYRVNMALCAYRVDMVSCACCHGQRSFYNSRGAINFLIYSFQGEKGESIA